MAAGGKRKLPASWTSPESARTTAASKVQTLNPVLLFQPRQCRYAHAAVEVDFLCQQLLSTGIKAFGLDIEWKVTFKAGQAPRPAALLQLCYVHPSSKACECLLLHIAHSGLTPHLRALLHRKDICKAGVGISGDAHKLARDYGIQVDGLLCLSEQANLRLPGPDGKPCLPQRWSLAALARVVLGKELPKDPELRLSDWEALPLSPQQQGYAAADAYASLRICQALARMPVIAAPPRYEVNPAPASQLLTQQDRQMELVAAAEAVLPLQPAKMALYRMVVEQGLSFAEAAQQKCIQLDTAQSYVAEAMLAGWPYPWHAMGIPDCLLHTIANTVQQIVFPADSPASAEQPSTGHDQHAHADSIADGPACANAAEGSSACQSACQQQLAADDRTCDFLGQARQGSGSQDSLQPEPAPHLLRPDRSMSQCGDPSANHAQHVGGGMQGLLNSAMPCQPWAAPRLQGPSQLASEQPALPCQGPPDITEALESKGVTLVGLRQLLAVEVPWGKLRLALAHMQRTGVLAAERTPD